jgi:ferric-dicitrate binding protein FerR (iron transport regulator)
VIDEDMTARLVRLGGTWPDVPFDRESRVKQAFLDEVRGMSRARAVRRRLLTSAAVIAMAAAVVLAVRVRPARDAAPAGVVVATVEQVEGKTRLGLGDAVRTGARIESGSASRIGLRLASGASLRFDQRSRAHLISQTRIQLDAGAVYVDTGSDLGIARTTSSALPSLEIATPLGIVRDIGTQFEVRLEDSALRLRVRSGVAEVRRGADVSSARPGTELTVTPERTTSRSTAAYGEAWAWAAGLAPVFEIEGRSLDAFLDYVCREQGWTLVYADSRLALEASGMILHGSTQGVPPSDALAIVLATTGLTHVLDDGELRVARAGRR